MIKNGLDIHTISTQWIDSYADRVLLFGQAKERIEKIHPLHFLKFHIASRTSGTLGFAQYTSHRFAKPKEPFLPKNISYEN